MGKNPITTEVLQKAPIPPACRKLLFKTDNSVGRLQEKPFQQNYVSLNEGAAEWLTGNNFDLVGIDYLSVEAYPSPDHRVHHHLLENDIILLEGLDLYHIPEGAYHLIALPLKVPGAEAVPVRAILLKKDLP
jgi:arylformamidase